MVESLPLTSLLSQVLIALTIETDNEFEQRVPHVTTDFGQAPRPGVWLTSYATYANFLRFVDDDGIRLADLAAAAGYDPPAHPPFGGMTRWGYVTYTPHIGASPRQKDGDAVVRCTPAGAAARDAWAAVVADVQARWAERGLNALQAALIPIVEIIERPLPEFMPAIGLSNRKTPDLRYPISRPAIQLGLLALLSQLLLAMTYDFEKLSPLSLATCGGLLQPLSPEPVLVRDLYDLSGVAKKEWGSAVGHLAKAGLAVVGPVPGGKAKSIALSPEGVGAQERAAALLRSVEAGWRKQIGPQLDSLRKELERVVDDAWSWTDPYPDGWRSKTKLPRHLAHHPIISHRGGYPDGS